MLRDNIQGFSPFAQVTRTAGTLEFVSYDEKIVLECQENALARSKSSGVGSSSDNAGSTSTSTGASASTVAGSANESPGDTCSVTVPVGLYYNDVWEYNLNCTRCEVWLPTVTPYALHEIDDVEPHTMC